MPGSGEPVRRSAVRFVNSGQQESAPPDDPVNEAVAWFGVMKTWQSALPASGLLVATAIQVTPRQCRGGDLDPKEHDEQRLLGSRS
jgi:hypothetical protein